ncbi:MAG: glucan biosynthesis protein G [Gammaproteobacteria bacterium]
MGMTRGCVPKRLTNKREISVERAIERRWWVAIVTGVTLVLGMAFSASALAFGMEEVAARAEKLAKEPFKKPGEAVPEWLRKINYDQWRTIRYRLGQALWRDRRSPFQVQFFHPGLYYDRTVTVNVVEADGVHPVAFSPSYFDYGDTGFASRVPQDLGYAGFRLHYPLKTNSYFDEVIVFLGAAYFRAVGRDDVFGVSARGLAVDTAARSGEEFPYFKEFWLVAPAPGAKDMLVYALLDSPSLTGAYRFLVRPGGQTIVTVDAQVFLRREVQKIGLAPLTSMYFFGENSRARFEDFRPEVHDSDGLLLHLQSGEWLWRPLDNPSELHVSAFKMDNPRGFGLLQRDRDFDHYQDLETHAERRPSLWIQPSGDWGAGRVELIEIPTDSEVNDNITAFWVPDKQPKPGQPFPFSYAMYWYADDGRRPPAGGVVATRRDRGTIEDGYRFVVDFAGDKLKALPAERVLRGVVTVAPSKAGQLLDQHVVKNPITGTWRLVFQMRAKSDDPIELRAYLDKGGDTLTETWSYVVRPD